MERKTYFWELLIDASRPGTHTYGLTTPNGDIAFTHSEDSVLCIFLNNHGEPNKFIIENLSTREYAFEGNPRKIRNWLPVVERSSGLPDKAKKDICALLEKIK